MPNVTNVRTNAQMALGAGGASGSVLKSASTLQARSGACPFRSLAETATAARRVGVGSREVDAVSVSTFSTSQETPEPFRLPHRVRRRATADRHMLPRDPVAVHHASAPTAELRRHRVLGVALWLRTAEHRGPAAEVAGRRPRRSD